MKNWIKIFYNRGTYMKLQQLLSYTRKAVDDYQMIQDGIVLP